MSFESYNSFYKDYKDGVTIRAHRKGAEFDFSYNTSNDKRYKLFVAGETTLFYQWKNEPDYPAHYHVITDALDTENADKAQYCLDFSSEKEEGYIKRIYKKIMWPPMLSYLPQNPVCEKWEMGLFVKAENLLVGKGGYLRMQLDIRYKKDGVSPYSNYELPDEVITINIPEGSYDWQRIAEKINIFQEKTASVGIWIEGTNYSGKLYIERPFLIGDDEHNLLPDFTVSVPGKNHFDWSAQNLSHKEWPKFRILLNDERIYEGEIFERCHRNSDWEVDIPNHLIKTKNKLYIELISDYHDPLPYTIHEVGIVEQNGGEVALIAVSDNAAAGGKAYALIRTQNPATRINVEYINKNISGKNEYYFEESGLNVIQIDCLGACENAEFKIIFEKGEIITKISRVVIKTEDNVITGTGDMVFIEQRPDYMEEYLSWYVSNNIGEFITIRPVYRWSGTRVINEKVWKDFVRVANDMGMKYVLMLDGRELPGKNCNPDDEMLCGNGYLGRQTHEQDGRLFYWRNRLRGVSVHSRQHADMSRRIDIENANNVKQPQTETCFYYENIISEARDINELRDTKVAKNNSAEMMANVLCHTKRHTGPSTMFKYIKEAGSEWIGAETMYGSMEPLLAFVRGVGDYIQKTDKFGVHHAVQWSTTPHDTPEHFRRYRLALYISYMQGATDINTEEGLWRMEEYYEYYHRFTDCCINHLKQQQDFNTYVQTHSRSGEFYTPFALVHGRYDGWHAFGNLNTWGWSNEEQTDAEDSWQLLKTFYPQSKPGEDLYFRGYCPDDKSLGYHSGTPLGNIDVIPAEGDSFNKYRAIAYVGYNCMEQEDSNKILKYVSDGGKVLLTRAHMTDTTLYENIRNYELNYSENDIIMTDGAPEFIKSSYNGINIDICINAKEPDEVIERTDDGHPLLSKYKYGNGEIILVNANVYPAHPAIYDIYAAELQNIMKSLTDEENVWAYTGDDTQFCVYNQEDNSRHIYFIAVDWYNNPEIERTAYLRIGDNKYPVNMQFGVMIKAVTYEDVAVWPHSEDGEVIYIKNNVAKVQGTWIVKFSIAKDGMVTDKIIDFRGCTVQEIVF